MLGSIGGLLHWDERTMLPPRGGDYRAEQLRLVAGMVHQRWTAPELGQWLDELATSHLARDSSSPQGATIRWLRWQYDRRRRLPQQLVEELAQVTVLAQQAWQEARKADDFTRFRPWLEKVFRLKREQAEAWGYDDTPYDALLAEYEPGMTTARVSSLLGPLAGRLVCLLETIRGASRRPRLEVLRGRFPQPAQEAFGRKAATAIGFDFSRGRLDVTAHPFCSRLGPNDCRITTRYNENDFAGSFFGILHEAGHGIYEQGLPAEWYGLPPGEPAGLGIHESQSRLWENLVGRSRGFWEYFFREAQQAFPAALGSVVIDDFLLAVNAVRPSLIRVEADEVTYNLHIVIRFDLEQQIVSGKLSVDELPEAWNEAYRRYLGMEPTGFADGVLQDIHWACGLLGYFPTYSLGNIYAAQLFAQAEQALGPPDEAFRRGRFSPLRHWLAENVYRHGRCYSASELIERATGAPPGEEPLLEYLAGKYGRLYRLN